ncbi:MAG TPA: FecR family protein [Polyangiales bacterium]|nr:FecR family protein [Polyangiales bacterium]
MSRTSMPASGSKRLADALRSAPEALDEIGRARMERNLVEAWRARGAHAVPLPGTRPALSRTLWMGSIAAAAALGLVFGLTLLRKSAETDPAQSVAHFDLVIGDGAVQSGVLSAGQVLESGKHGHIEVSQARSRLDIAPESRVRFESLDRDDLRLSLVQGRVDVAFHPERKGEQSMSIETGSARVVVVGTRFAVEVNDKRETRVSVSEGVVRVEPRRGGAAVMVRAGERLSVPAEAEPELSTEHEAEAAEPPVEGASAEPEPADSSSASRAGRSRKTTAASSGSSSFDEKLENARKQLLEGKHAAARERLSRLIKNTLPPSTRCEAWVLMAESLTAQGQVPRAAAAYREAVASAPGEPAGNNAQFALARLLDRYTSEHETAAEAYREYLAKAPHGPLARQARDALCRLSHCQ